MNRAVSRLSLMKKPSLVKVGGVIISTLVLFGPAFSQEEDEKKLPFAPTPEGLKEYAANSKTDGNPVEYFNLRNCRSYMYEQDYESYECDADYKERSSLGERTCIGGGLEYNYYIFGRDLSVSKPDECGPWEKVSTTTQPQTETGEQTPENAEETNPDTITKNELILAGSGVVLISSALAFVFGRMSRK